MHLTVGKRPKRAMADIARKPENAPIATSTRVPTDDSIEDSEPGEDAESPLIPTTRAP